MKSSICPVCNSSKTTEIYPADINLKKLSFSYAKTPDSNKTFRVIRCGNCTHVFCSPIPKNIYKNYEDVVDKEYLKYTVSLQASANEVLPLIKKYSRTGILLDVGCATGEFLLIARQFGYKVEGLELSKWSSDIAINKGLKIFRHSIKDHIKAHSGRYEVITLFGVIEHFEFPLNEMKNLSKLLKPGGVLVIWTGDVDSSTSKVLGRRWWYWQGQHIQYFTERSLKLLGNLNGIKHLKTEKYPFVATEELMNNYLGRYYFRPWLMKFLKPFFIFKPSWILRLPGEMFWIGRKTK